MIRSKPRRGFTLLECLLVLALFASLALLVTPNWSAHSARGTLAQIEADFVATSWRVLAMWRQRPLDCCADATVAVPQLGLPTEAQLGAQQAILTYAVRGGTLEIKAVVPAYRAGCSLTLAASGHMSVHDDCRQ